MTSVRTVVHPGWLEVTGPGVHAVVAAADRHADALRVAAAGGLLPLLEALTAHGIAGAPDFAVVAVGDEVVRVLARGSAVVALADGTRVGSDGRMPWADVDLDLAAVGDEVVLEAPEPETPRGWRRPARLARAAAAPADLTKGRGNIDLLVDPAPGDADREDVEERPGTDLSVDEGTPEPEPEAAAPADEATPPQPDLTLPPPDDALGLPPVARVPASPPPRGALIDAVPWRRGGDTPAPLPPTAAMPVVPPPPVLPSEPEPSADHDVEAQHDAADGTAEVPAPEVAPSPPAEATAPPEHAVPDVTTDRGSLHRTDDDLDRPVVLAVVCPAGHPSPPHAGRCRTCDREIPPQQPFQTPRPPLGVLRVSTGGTVPLDRGVLLGRAPRVNEELPANQRPHLLRVGGVDRDISRNHAEVVLEGWHVIVRDLGSTNGTTVTLPGQEPVRLRPTEDQGIEPGAVITLADEVSLTYEVEA